MRTRIVARILPGKRSALSTFVLIGLALFCARSELRAQQGADEDRDEQRTGLWQAAPGSAVEAAFDPESLARLRSRAEMEKDPESWLAFGAALLQSGDWQGAAPALREALESEDLETREDAAYDLALAWAVAGAPGSAQSGTVRSGGSGDRPEGESLDDPGTPRERLLRARDGFRAVLRADPGSEDARWNLELVNRWLDQENSGGSSEDDSGGAQAAGSPDSEGGSGGAPMTPEEAQRLLDAAAGQEREVQARRMERNRDRDPVQEKNW